MDTLYKIVLYSCLCGLLLIAVFANINNYEIHMVGEDVNKQEARIDSLCSIIESLRLDKGKCDTLYIRYEGVAPSQQIQMINKTTKKK